MRNGTWIEADIKALRFFAWSLVVRLEGGSEGGTYRKKSRLNRMNAATATTHVY